MRLVTCYLSITVGGGYGMHWSTQASSWQSPLCLTIWVLWSSFEPRAAWCQSASKISKGNIIAPSCCKNHIIAPSCGKNRHLQLGLGLRVDVDLFLASSCTSILARHELLFHNKSAHKSRGWRFCATLASTSGSKRMLSIEEIAWD